jgi:anhydro-N-acetylmuramic acid kinase
MKNITIGIMSGTSLDGLDIALCNFTKDNNGYKFEILHAETIDYSIDWKNRLKNAALLNAPELCELNSEYGSYIGYEVKEFLEKLNKPIKISAVGSHGHTVFHQPENGFTLQIGSGAHIAAIVNSTVVCSFREFDVALGGQGAPLVPIGDNLLFGDYDICINLGGFSNISFNNESGKRIAYDICPVNILANYFSQNIGLEFDTDGELGKLGTINIELLNSLNALEFYTKNHPKSLGREWLEKEVLPLFSLDIGIEDKLRTLYEHIAIQISNNIVRESKVLLTGGGVHNKYLIELIKQYCSAEIVIPDKTIIDYKEAMIFAFLAHLKLNNEINVLASATGASRDHSSGIVYK